MPLNETPWAVVTVVENDSKQISPNVVRKMDVVAIKAVADGRATEHEE